MSRAITGKTNYLTGRFTTASYDSRDLAEYYSYGSDKSLAYVRSRNGLLTRYLYDNYGRIDVYKRQDHIHPRRRVVNMTSVNVQRPFEMHMVEIGAVGCGFGQVVPSSVYGVGRVELDAERFEVGVDDIPLVRLVDIVVPRAVVNTKLYPADGIVDERLEISCLLYTSRCV